MQKVLFSDIYMAIFSLRNKIAHRFFYFIHTHKDIDVYMKEACYGMMCYTLSIIT